MVVNVARILIVTTSANVMGDLDLPTGVWAEELAVPWYMFKNRANVDIASIKGGLVPIDPASVDAEAQKSPCVRQFLADDELQSALQDTVSIVLLAHDPYAAIFVPGGHGIAWDGPYNKELQRLLGAQLAAGKVVGAVCHGPAALVDVRDASGKCIVAGKQVTGFSNKEEAAVGHIKHVPFLLEDKLKQMGGLYTCAPGPWLPHAVRAGTLVTGQNPASSKQTAELVIDALTFGVALTP